MLKSALKGAALLAVLAFVLPGTALAGDQFFPVKTVQAKGPVLVYPFAVPPYIQHVYSYQPEHENPKIPMKPAVGTNTLKVGGLLPFSQGLFNAPKFLGITFTDLVPPDSNGCVGPNNVIVTVNCSFAIFKKDGTKLAEKLFTSLFAPVEVSTFVSDPIAIYDKTTDRYLLSIDCIDFSGSKNQQLIAISKTNDPMGAWYLYGIDSSFQVNSVGFWMDYPKYGFNNDAVVIAGNMFNFAGTASDGANILTLNKGALFSGAAVTAKVFSFPSEGTIEPARQYQASDPNIYGLAVASGNQLSLFSITNPGTANPVVNRTVVSIPNMNAPFNDAVAPQGHMMDAFTGDGRLYSCAFRNGHLVTAHNVDHNGNVAIRWYDIQPNAYPVGTPALIQTGEIDGASGTDVFQPAINMNSKGTIGIVYSQSGPSLAPRLMFTSRFKTDPLGFLAKPQIWQLSLGPTYGDPGFNRWGDYFAVDIDPTDDKTFWMVGMVGDSGFGWNAYFTKFFIDTFQQGTSPTSIAMFEGTSSSGSVASVLAIDPARFSVASKQVGTQGQIASALASISAGPPQGSVSYAHIDYVASAALGVSNYVYAYNWTTLRYDVIQSVALNGSDTAFSANIAGVNVPNYINPSTGEMKVILRAISPQHLTTPPQPFSLNINYLKFVREEF